MRRPWMPAFVIAAALSVLEKSLPSQESTSIDPPPGTTGNADNVRFIGGRDPKGNPVRLARKSGHVSNYDEAKVADYVLPDPFKMSDGSIVATPEQWKRRRIEIRQFFEEQIYGRVPANVPKVKWEITENDQVSRDDVSSSRKLKGMVGSNNIPPWNVVLYLPKNTSGPVPVLLNLSFFGNDRTTTNRRSETNPVANDPIAVILARGWGYAQIGYSDIQPDKPDPWQQGIIGQTLVKGQAHPAEDEWGTISAWAWGASRVIDYLATDPNVDANRIAISGTSRLGKTALWAAAMDERISSVFSIVPGEMGASLIRRDWGETLDDMAQNFSYQFSGNLQRWVGRWNDLPVDQHLLIALIAPRPVYVNGGLGDQWSDPKGEFLALVAAEPVYRLLGREGLGMQQLPELDRPLISGSLGFHYHSKGHQAVPEDWQYFLDFAERAYRTYPP